MYSLRHSASYSDRAQHTTDLNDGLNHAKLQSVTQQNDLEEFFENAQLAGTSFVAGKAGIK
jgi:hypothetical protein